MFDSAAYRRAFDNQTQWSLDNFKRMRDAVRCVGTVMHEAGAGRGGCLGLVELAADATQAAQAPLDQAVSRDDIVSGYVLTPDMRLSKPLPGAAVRPVTGTVLIVEGTSAAAVAAAIQACRARPRRRSGGPRDVPAHVAARPLVPYQTPEIAPFVTAVLDQRRPRLGNAGTDKGIAMEQARGSLTVRAQRQGLVEITREIAAWLAEQKVSDGLLTVFIRHTSASLLIQENVDAKVQRDLESFLMALVPEFDMGYRHDAEGPDDMPTHIKGALDPDPSRHPGQRRATDARQISAASSCSSTAAAPAPERSGFSISIRQQALPS